MDRICFLVFALQFLSLSGLAQAQSLSGTVLDPGSESIPGVNILNLQNGAHTHTDDQGEFVLESVQIFDSIQISMVGFVTSVFVVDQLNEPLELILERKSFSLDEVVISSGPDALNLFTEIDLKVSPVNSSQEVLRQVPGLFIGQHAGGGKAEQIFLRGFDVDHGTDVRISVDGMPVNLVSHAHGQGYADLHFLIPETIERVELGKGPYDSEQGNFATAGHVDFQTKERLSNSMVSIEGGQFSTRRLLGMFKVLDQDKHQAYIAAESLGSDGPFDSPQNFNRSNLMTKYSGYTSPRDQISVSASTFSSNWDASGQIPQRKVDDGTIGRFGAIDDTEGGQTSRSNLILSFDRMIDERTYMKNTLYTYSSEFELYSNFTFFLNDSINGDQIRQIEDRRGIGLNSEYGHSFSNDTWSGFWKLGLGYRYDRTEDTELSHTRNRKETLEFLKLGDILESNVSMYSELKLDLGAFTIGPALRVDVMDFQYTDDLSTAYSNDSKELYILSPKLNILYNANQDLQFYLKSGKGFHSNDSRVVVLDQADEVLPAAYGADLGLNWKLNPRVLLNLAVWELYLEQEFVYVGDEGIVEPSGKTERQGVDMSLRFQASSWLYGNLDANYTIARSVDSPSGEQYIPLAPEQSLVAGLHAVQNRGIYGGIELRYLGDRPATEDRSIIADGYSVIDVNLGYSTKRVDISARVQNLMDTEWNETQFATESRLLDEPEPTTEIHFTPGTPFFLSAKVTYLF